MADVPELIMGEASIMICEGKARQERHSVAEGQRGSGGSSLEKKGRRASQTSGGRVLAHLRVFSLRRFFSGV